MLRRTIDPDKVRELADSIAKVGLLQPLVVVRAGTGWEVVAGHRRLLALRLLKWTTIPAMEYKGPGTSNTLAAVAENCARVDLTPVEEADAVLSLVVDDGNDVDQVAQAFGHSRSWVDKRLEIAGWPEDIRRAVHEDKIGLAAATELAAIKDPGYRDYYLTSAISGGCTATTARMWRSEWEARGGPTMGAPDANQPAPTYHPPPAAGLECSNCKTLTRLDLLTTLHICPACLGPKEPS